MLKINCSKENPLTICSIYATLNSTMNWKIYKTTEYLKWFDGLAKDRKAQLIFRLQKIVEHGYLGNSRALGDGLFELKFNDGMRVYFCFSGKQIILLLIGGDKHGQEKDIKKARNLKKSYAP